MDRRGGGIATTITVDPSGGWFRGHFEGRPILPGIAHLALVRDAARTALSPDLEIAALASLRLRRVVQPGDELALRLDAVAPGETARFELRSGEAVSSTGSLVFATGAPVPPRGAEAASPRAGGPSPAALIPHRPPMLLVESLGDAGEDGLTATGRIPRDNAFVAGGSAPGFVALELAAQAAAAFEALARRRDGGDPEPRVGYLVGAKGARFDTRLPAGAPLTVTIRMTGAALPLTTYSLTVRSGDALCADGSISTYIA